MKIHLKGKAKKDKDVSVRPLATNAEGHLELPEKYHSSRPQKKCCGELIQMNASVYNRFGESASHLHLAIDDASDNTIGAYFDRQETLKGYYHVLLQTLSK